MQLEDVQLEDVQLEVVQLEVAPSVHQLALFLLLGRFTHSSHCRLNGGFVCDLVETVPVVVRVSAIGTPIAGRHVEGRLRSE